MIRFRETGEKIDAGEAATIAEKGASGLVNVPSTGSSLTSVFLLNGYRGGATIEERGASGLVRAGSSI